MKGDLLISHTLFRNASKLDRKLDRK